MVAVFLAEGFEICEAMTPVDYLRRAGVETVMVSLKEGPVKSSCGVAVSADMTLEELGDRALTAVVLPGGMPGAENLSKCRGVNSAVDAVLEKGGLVAAICASPAVVLASRGLLDGKKAVCYPSFKDEMKGAAYLDCHFVYDKPFLTGKAAGSATDFSLKLVELLCGAETMDKVKKSLCL